VKEKNNAASVGNR